MDPDEALAMMRAAMEIMSKDADTVGPEAWMSAGFALAEAAAALDTWMANGGFLPAGWMIHRTEAETITFLREQARLMNDVTRAQKATIDELRAV